MPCGSNSRSNLGYISQSDTWRLLASIPKGIPNQRLFLYHRSFDSAILEKGFRMNTSLANLMAEIESTFPKRSLTPTDPLAFTKSEFKRVVSEMLENSTYELAGVRYYEDRDSDQQKYIVSIYVDLIDRPTRMIRSLTCSEFVPISAYMEKPYYCPFSNIIIGYDERVLSSFVLTRMHRKAIDFLNNMELRCAYPQSHKGRPRDDYRINIRVRPAYRPMG
ncbi:hypothetical protein UFOVP448_53 [uncultured Caudovirales phage]|uniref:Uncharacterized protein n=1 Tax=uncultured Caudovirales phage TaxID=2100421 RepID=A0A6J5MB46_9CAUD|nr:hypothetical protein UFOVP448_53 [uncultured Caudovirales phage]